MTNSSRSAAESDLPYITPNAFAALLGVSVDRLRDVRSTGDALLGNHPPEFIKISRRQIRYPWAEVRRFMSELGMACPEEPPVWLLRLNSGNRRRTKTDG